MPHLYSVEKSKSLVHEINKSFPLSNADKEKVKRMLEEILLPMTIAGFGRQNFLMKDQNWDSPYNLSILYVLQPSPFYPSYGVIIARKCCGHIELPPEKEKYLNDFLEKDSSILDEKTFGYLWEIFQVICCVGEV